MSVWLQPYYLVNAGVVASWAYLRLVVPGNELIRKDDGGTWFKTQEREIFLMVGFGLLAKVRRASSLHEYIYKITLYGKVAVALCLFRCGFFLGLALYACVLSFLFVALPTPKFSGSKYVETLNAAKFAERALRLSKSPMCIVMFKASWCESCVHAEPLFCSLAAQYSSKKRIFCTVDVAENPTIARRFEIDTSYKTLQLPTFALFYRGREKLRLPYFDDKKTIVKTKFTRDSLESFLLLDKPYKEAVDAIDALDTERAVEKARVSGKL